MDYEVKLCLADSILHYSMQISQNCFVINFLYICILITMYFLCVAEICSKKNIYLKTEHCGLILICRTATPSTLTLPLVTSTKYHLTPTLIPQKAILSEDVMSPRPTVASITMSASGHVPDWRFRVSPVRWNCLRVATVGPLTQDGQCLRQFVQ